MSIVETTESFMTIQINSFETPILMRKDLKRKRFSKKFQIISQWIWFYTSIWVFLKIRFTAESQRSQSEIFSDPVGRRRPACAKPRFAGRKQGGSETSSLREQIRDTNGPRARGTLIALQEEFLVWRYLLDFAEGLVFVERLPAKKICPPRSPAVIFLFWTRMKFQKETLTRTKWEYDLNRRGAWVRSVYRFFTILSTSLAIGFLHLTILQNHWVNIFSTINTLPHPKALGFIINLFVNHHTPTTVAFRKSFFHPSPPLERGSFIRVVDLKIPGATILSILKMRLWKLSFNRLGRNFRRHNLLILRRRQIPPFGTGLKATLRINPEQTPGFRPGIVEGLIKPHPGGEGSMKFPPPLVLFGMKF